MLFFIIILNLLIYYICASQVEYGSISTQRRLLNDGNWMPATALGTFITDLDDRPKIPQVVTWAFEAGCRHIDTAPIYLTEDMIGKAIVDAISRGIVKRPEIYITSKIPLSVCSRDQVIPALEDALKRLQIDYIDLYLIHTPRNPLGIKNCDFLELWRGLEDAKRRGLTRSIGVSNFNSTQINRILANCVTRPAVNQIETNPTFADQELVTYCQSQSIVVTGYAPFGFAVPRPRSGGLFFPPSFDDPIIVGLAEKYGVNSSQIFLRYLLDRQIIPIAGSLNKQHIESNADIFDFCLSPEEVLIINEFDVNVKVYVGDYDGLEEQNRAAFLRKKRYVLRNKLRQYYNVFLYK